MRTITLTDAQYEHVLLLVEEKSVELADHIHNPASQQSLVDSLNEMDALLETLDKAIES